MFEQYLLRWLAWAADPEQARRAPLLARSPMFAGLPRRHLARLGTRFLEKRLQPGRHRLPGGRSGPRALRRRRGYGGDHPGDGQGEYVLRALGPGDAFGEIALIDDFPRSATARVATLARLLVLYKSDFDALMDGNAQITNVVMRNLAHLLAIYARRSPVVVTDPNPPQKTEGPP